MEKEEIKEQSESMLADTAASLKEMIGNEYQFGRFVATINDNGDVVVGHDNGWSMTIPALTSAWCAYAGWMMRWDDSAKNAFAAAVEMIVYPVSMLISSSDEKFIEDVIAAQDSLVGRMEMHEEEEDAEVAYEVSRDVLKGLMS